MNIKLVKCKNMKIWKLMKITYFDFLILVWKKTKNNNKQALGNHNLYQNKSMVNPWEQDEASITWHTACMPRLDARHGTTEVLFLNFIFVPNS